MSGVLKVSEAVSLALHAMYVLAIEEDQQKSVREIASFLDISANHLAKVLQQLTKAGLVRSVRGPTGGFLLAKAPSKITLIEIYEAVSGKVEPARCLLKKQVCHSHCLLGGLLGSIDQQVMKHLEQSRLSDFVVSQKKDG